MKKMKITVWCPICSSFSSYTLIYNCQKRLFSIEISVEIICTLILFFIVMGMVFPVVLYYLWELDHKEGWAPRNWCFQTVALEKILESPLDTREINQVILKEISHEYLLEGLMLKLKLSTLATWFKELTHWKRLRCWERLRSGGEGCDRRWAGWVASPTQWIGLWANSRI